LEQLLTTTLGAAPHLVRGIWPKLQREVVEDAEINRSLQGGVLTILFITEFYACEERWSSA
jgi:hypothetical protein